MKEKNLGGRVSIENISGKPFEPTGKPRSSPDWEARSDPDQGEESVEKSHTMMIKDRFEAACADLDAEPRAKNLSDALHGLTPEIIDALYVDLGELETGFGVFPSLRDPEKYDRAAELVKEYATTSELRIRKSLAGQIEAL